jgi:cell wall-associated NlpC family hydrolase
VGYEIGTQEVRPGDLLFFRTASREASHVAIAIDGTRFVHAPNSKGVVRIDRLSTPYWSTRLLGARRIE